jgi:hypothetical protein
LTTTQLNATASVAGTFTYSPAAGAVLAPGTQTLSTTFTPSDAKDYTSASSTVQLTVNNSGSQSTPTISWATPAAISYGTALGGAQLNATANVPGNFTYTPAAGTVLPAGMQTLSTTFTPSDAKSYTSATAQTILTVKAAGTTPTPPPASPVLPTPSGCGGPTINLNSGMSQATLQSNITNAASCSLIVFSAGNYSLSTHLEIPCKNLQITGPVAATPTANLSASFTNDDIFVYDGNCASLGSVNYLHFANAGGIYVRGGNNGNFLVQYNLVTNLPSQVSSAGGIYSTAESGVFLDGSMSNTTSNVDIEHNTFGDTNSCAAAFPLATDEGGSCAGVLTHTGAVVGLTVNHNKFIHVEEGIHIEQLANFSVGAKSGTCTSCVISYNYISNYHRIGIEIQISTPTNSIMLEHNSIVDPINSSWGTMGISMACCEYGNIFGTAGASPGYIANDNVLVSTLPIGNSGWPPPIGIEFWGNGAIGENNLLQGTWGNGYTWGYGGGSWQINNNFICGARMAANKTFVEDEEGQPTAPTQSGNVTGATCSATTSKAPAISPAGGSFSGSQTVTLSDAGTNTGVWYTTDGSTPVPGAGTAQFYTGPFSVSSNTTVKAVGMWGTIDQPVSYPAGYGYVPSGVASATFVAGSVSKSPSSKVSAASEGVQVAQAGSLVAVEVSPAKLSVSIGGTTQAKALAVYSDGSTRDITNLFAWVSSDPRTVEVNSSGEVSGLASGKLAISGSWQGMRASIAVQSTAGVTHWDAPIVITQGGTYTGNWQSIDGRTAAVTIATSAPVVIESAHLRSNSNLIEVQTKGADVTVRNSVGLVLGASSKGQTNGVFLEVNAPAHLDVENNYIENARDGVVVHGYAGSRSAAESLIVRANRVRNLNGQLSDGVGGYLAGSVAGASRFVHLDGVQGVPGVEFGWNEVINYPGHSVASDVIHVFRSSGTANRPLDIHDMYIQGAYPIQPAHDAYSGGGIKTDGRMDDDATNATAFVDIHDNQVISTVSYGISFAAGHDNIAWNNRVISSGLLHDGTKIAAQRVGLSNANQQGDAGRGASYNNIMRDNLVGWACWTSACAQQGYRHDLYFPAAPGDYAANTTVAAQSVTQQIEEDEYQLWSNKRASAGIKVGPSF